MTEMSRIIKTTREVRVSDESELSHMNPYKHLIVIYSIIMKFNNHQICTGLRLSTGNNLTKPTSYFAGA